VCIFYSIYIECVLSSYLGKHTTEKGEEGRGEVDTAEGGEVDFISHVFLAWQAMPGAAADSVLELPHPLSRRHQGY
jgi:hypothetical protein